MGETSDEWLTLLETPGSGYVWSAQDPPASEPDLEALTRYVGRPLPIDYSAFLRKWGGGELWYRDEWDLRFWNARDIPAWAQAYGFTPKRMPGAIPFGDNGGGEAIVFDVRPEHPDGHYPIIAVNFTSIDWDATIFIANSFRELLQLRRPIL